MPYDLEDLNSMLETVKSNSKVSIHIIGNTHMNRPIPAIFIKSLQQDRPQSRLALCANGRQCHGIGFKQLAFDGLPHPAIKLTERTRMQITEVQRLFRVITPHIRQIHNRLSTAPGRATQAIHAMVDDGQGCASVTECQRSRP